MKCDYLNSLTVCIRNIYHIISIEFNNIINCTGYKIIYNIFLEIWFSKNILLPETLVHLRLDTQFMVNVKIIYSMIYNT